MTRQFGNNVKRFGDNPIIVKSALIISKGTGSKTNTDGRIPHENQITTRLRIKQSNANHTTKETCYYNTHSSFPILNSPLTQKSHQIMLMLPVPLCL